MSSDADATVVLPTPGRKRYQYSPALERPAAAADLARLGGLNPLIEAANPLLAAIPQIRHALRHPDPAGLRARLRGQIDAFERGARGAAPAESVVTARYALCALLDDSAAATPWGREWATKGFVAELHGEPGGGEKFFDLLERLSADAARQLDLLEFFYVCLALGFEGKYRGGGEGGRQALAQIRGRLYDAITAQRPAGPGGLAGRWRGAAMPARRVPGALALWAAVSVCAALAALIYLVARVSLGAASDPVAEKLAQLKPVPLAGRTAAAPAPKPAATAALAAALAADIARGEVAVSDAAGGSLVVLRADELFASGSARLNGALEPLVVRIAEALDKTPGAVLVTGHTDNVPIRTARFPSNWELSAERARSVVELMGSRVREPARLRAEGVADAEPLAPNDGAANRARNRRVAILLRSAP